jgi:hypothetical protein
MDEEQRDIYNRFGSVDNFDPRKDEFKLIADLLTIYLFWGVVAFIFTLPASARGSRTWITIGGIVMLVIDVALKLSETTVPTWFPKTLTEFEFIFYVYSAFPFFLAVLRAYTESVYIDLDSVTMTVLTDVTRHQKVSVLSNSQLPFQPSITYNRLKCL